MEQKTLRNVKKYTFMWWIGVWATIWWAVSGLYLALLVWMSQSYITIGEHVRTSFVGAWSEAISKTFTQSTFLQLTLLFVIAIWIIGGLVWLYELRQQRMSYRAAFKDLFLTIHK